MHQCVYTVVLRTYTIFVIESRNNVTLYEISLYTFRSFLQCSMEQNQVDLRMDLFKLSDKPVASGM